LRRLQVTELRQYAELRRHRLQRPCSCRDPRVQVDEVVRGGGYSRLVGDVVRFS
jgi:hypothetical protein